MTWGGFRLGLTTGVALAAGVLPYGMAFGALAAQQGFSTLAASAMSAMVHSGAAQFAALQVWTEPLVLSSILFTVFAMNARYVLYGAMLRPVMQGLSPLLAYPALFVMGDANWALMMRHGRAGSLDGAFALGTGLMMYAAWQLGTWLGCLFGSLDFLALVPLAFVLPLYFATMLIGLWRGRGDLLPLAAAAAVALTSHWLVGPAWSVVCGGLAGALAGAWRGPCNDV